MIHPTAIIHPQAKLDATVRVGPYAVIDADVELGADCVVGPHVYLTGVTKIGRGNKFHASCVIGDAPQDLKYKNEPTGLRIGDQNIFREHVTVHRATKPGEETVIGAHNYFMAGTHVGHNCNVGNHVIMVNGAVLGGHVTVQDRALLSAHCGIHQFRRIGTLSLTQGCSIITQDLPPFTIAAGVNIIRGLNVVGLRRAGFTAEQRLELKKLYHLLFRSGKNMSVALAEAKENFNSAPAKILMDFVASAKHGVCADIGRAMNKSEDE
jgi:UDP-N-acetylglucosamine acyltransferase